MDYRQPEWGAFLTEMKGYFFFFGGTLLFKRALKVCKIPSFVKMSVDIKFRDLKKKNRFFSV